MEIFKIYQIICYTDLKYVLQTCLTRDMMSLFILSTDTFAYIYIYIYAYIYLYIHE